MLGERSHTFVEKIKKYAMENVHQQAEVTRKIAEAEVKRLTEFVQFSAAKGVGSNSSMQVRLTRAGGVASSVMEGFNYLPPGVQKVDKASARQVRRHQGFCRRSGGEGRGRHRPSR